MKAGHNGLIRLFLYLSALLVLSGCGGSDNNETFVPVDDPVLQSCYWPRLSEEEWKALTEFKCSGMEDISAADFSQLKRLPNLVAIKLWVGGRIDVSSLTGLSGLIRLEMQSRITSVHPSSSVALFVENLSALATLPSLTTLKLDTARFDIDQLAGFSQIQSLDISFTSHTDLSVLSNLTQLKELYINRTSSTGFNGGRAISDISPLALLTQLEKLDLGSNIMSDISALSGLTLLKELNLSGNDNYDGGGIVANISPLATLTRLEKLNLARNTIANISALATMPQLTELDISENQIKDISPIFGLRQPLAIELGWNCIENFENLPENFEVSGEDDQTQTEGACSE